MVAKYTIEVFGFAIVPDKIAQILSKILSFVIFVQVSYNQKRAKSHND